MLFKTIKNAQPAVSLPMLGHSLKGAVTTGGVSALETPAKILKNAPIKATEAKTAPIRRSAPLEECPDRVPFVAGRPVRVVADPDGI